MKDHYIIGKNCLSELLRFSPESLKTVYTSNPEDPFCKEIAKIRIPLQISSKQHLTKMVDSESHQGFVALVRERKYIDYREFLVQSQEKARSLVLMVDSVYDPQNLGAILRAGECFGIDLLILCKNRGCGITPVTAKTSAGGSELVPIANVSNLVETMAAFQKAGYWSVAAEVREGAHSIYEFSAPEKCLIILGSEGKGIQPLLSKKSDFHLYIPMLGRIDSLNVSQAAAVFLSTFRSKELCNTK